MKFMTIHAFALAAAVAVGLAFGAVAQDASIDPTTLGVDELVDARGDLMKQNGGILRGAGGLSGSDAEAAADTLIANFTALPGYFPEGSINADSKALPVIWERWDEFAGIFEAARGHAEAMKAAAAAGDAAAYGQAAQAIGGTCGQCHGEYRAR